MCVYWWVNVGGVLSVDPTGISVTVSVSGAAAKHVHQ